MNIPSFCATRSLSGFYLYKLSDKSFFRTKGQILKDVLVRAKLPWRLLHVDWSCSGLSRQLSYSGPLCTCGFGIRGKIRRGLRFFSVFLCGFAVFRSPLRPPLKLLVAFTKIPYLLGINGILRISPASGVRRLFEGSAY